LQNMKRGGAGCISAVSNINAGAIHQLYADWQSDAAEEQQQKLDRIRGVLAQYPMIPAMKATIGEFLGDPQWGAVRPPLVSLTDEQTTRLLNELHALDFAMPGLNAGSRFQGVSA
jgi:4-hydroxy-tetrahydrodipicolinate synthase